MDRRVVLTSTVATGIYFWLPKITIAKAQGHIDDLTVKTTDIICDNMELVTGHRASDDSEVSEDFKPEVRKAKRRLVERGYSDYDQPHSYSETPRRSSRRRAMVLARHTDRVNYGNAYVTGNTNNGETDIAYLPLVPFVRHGQIAAVARKKNFSKSQMIAYLYPIRGIDYMTVYLGDNITEEKPVRVLCEEGIWALTCIAHGRWAGHGRHTLYRKSDMAELYAEHYEYDFS